MSDRERIAEARRKFFDPVEQAWSGLKLSLSAIFHDDNAAVDRHRPIIEAAILTAQPARMSDRERIAALKAYVVHVSWCSFLNPNERTYRRECDCGLNALLYAEPSAPAQPEPRVAPWLRAEIEMMYWGTVGDEHPDRGKSLVLRDTVLLVVDAALAGPDR